MHACILRVSWCKKTSYSEKKIFALCPLALKNYRFLYYHIIIYTCVKEEGVLQSTASRSPEKFKIRTHATEWIQDKIW